MNQVPLDEYLASLPYRAGYELTSKHVVVVPLDGAGTPRVMAAFEWNTGRSTDHEAQFVTTHLAGPMNQETPDVLLIVGYGPQGATRATALGQAMLGSVSPKPGLLLVHIEGDQIRTSHTAGLSWEPSRRLPAAALAIAEGLPAPADDRAAVAARYAPLDAPGAASVSKSQAVRLAMTAPALRAEILTRAIDHLSVPGQGEDATKMGLVAHLIGTDVLMRDVAIAHAGQSLARADALVRTFRAAQPAQRAPVSAAAAAATFLAAGTPVAVEALLNHAQPSARDRSLGQLIRMTQVAGLPPAPLRAALVGDVDKSVSSAEEAWQASTVLASPPAEQAQQARRPGVRAAERGHPAQPRTSPSAAPPR